MDVFGAEYRYGTVTSYWSWECLLHVRTSRLKPDGHLQANLDLANIKLEKGSAARRIPKALREAGLQYDRRKRLLIFSYLGADDQAGPNYTGQPAVDSYYRLG